MSNERGTHESVRDAAVEAAWRAASTEEPAPRADAVILAAARAEVRPQQGSARVRRATRWWVRWQPLAAAAGVAGLAFLVAQRLPTETEHTKTFEAPARTTPASSARPEPDNEAGARGAEGASIAEPPRAMQPQSAVPAADAPPPRPVQAPSRMNAAVAQPSAQGSTEDLAAAHSLQSSAPLSRQQAAGISAERPMSDVLDADDWVHRIVTLHEAGNLPAAADELRAFRRAYPDADARLPADLRQWASSVEPGDQR
jgi:hypothetical protein